MGISERREKEKEDLQKSILAAAQEIFLEKGYEQTSIRNIAQKINYSPTTIYLYFKDKTAIFHALHSQGFQLLQEKMEPLFSVEDPFQRLLAMGRIYIAFAAENAAFYDLMFVQKEPIEFLDDEPWKEGESTFGGLMYTIQQCMENNSLNFDDPEVGAFTVWSALHGMITLTARDRCMIISEEKQDKIVELSFNAFIGMLNQFKKE